MPTIADYHNFWARIGSSPRTRYRRRVPVTRPRASNPEPRALLDACHAALGWFEAHPEALEESARLWVVPLLRRVLEEER